MRMIEIASLANGAHGNQTYNGIIPDGWAIVPDDIDTPNYPFGEVEVNEVDGVITVSKWDPLPIPELDEPTPAELREHAYNTNQIIPYGGEFITVTEAALRWQYYAAEGSEKADELQRLISAAKDEIRKNYPDETEGE